MQQYRILDSEQGECDNESQVFDCLLCLFSSEGNIERESVANIIIHGNSQNQFIFRGSETEETLWNCEDWYIATKELQYYYAYI